MSTESWPGRYMIDRNHRTARLWSIFSGSLHLVLHLYFEVIWSICVPTAPLYNISILDNTPYFWPTSPNLVPPNLYPNLHILSYHQNYTYSSHALPFWTLDAWTFDSYKRFLETHYNAFATGGRRGKNKSSVVSFKVVHPGVEFYGMSTIIA